MTHFSKELIEFYESRLPYTAIDQWFTQIIYDK